MKTKVEGKLEGGFMTEFELFVDDLKSGDITMLVVTREFLQEFGFSKRDFGLEAFKVADIPGMAVLYYMEKRKSNIRALAFNYEGTAAVQSVMAQARRKVDGK